ncbi:MAG: CPBP family intramembrane metalloprotease [candidate division KSB1 bacterium]|nr:CPBP family intramembrane metalloprotease [candidate division KSB1 bacterium]MDZ7295426.1 CPBP family intramembrane metalloprotease [candidate division KSB1 bacterium]MDZ7378544.1 CPBP family intramembrane metalloprotease [candidate division KSB1 bacterium]MDZ7386740.1 CPBP family intramembrane metalloprotease [candidate division KSB1 bacterium]MDZ7392003.1 CPBP family intramembrane metalloprotease [candidate division KSB1 bacterium]
MEEKASHPVPSAPHPGLGLSIGIIFITLLFMIVVTVGAAFFLSKKLLLVAELSIILPAVVATVAGRYPFARVFRLRTVSWSQAVLALLIGVAATVVMDELDRLVNLVFPMPEALVHQIKQLLTISSPEEGVSVVLFAVLAAGLLEEMLFRGFLQQSFERSIDASRGIVFCALAFALLHMNPWTSLQILVFGVLLGLLAWRSDSVLPSAIVHATNNGLSVLGINLGFDQASWYLWHGHVRPRLLVPALILLVGSVRLFFAVCRTGETRKT